MMKIKIPQIFYQELPNTPYCPIPNMSGFVICLGYDDIKIGLSIKSPPAAPQFLYLPIPITTKEEEIVR